MDRSRYAWLLYFPGAVLIAAGVWAVVYAYQINSDTTELLGFALVLAEVIAAVVAASRGVQERSYSEWTEIPWGGRPKLWGTPVRPTGPVEATAQPAGGEPANLENR